MRHLRSVCGILDSIRGDKMLTDDAIKVLEFLQSTRPNLQYKFFEVPFIQEKVSGVSQGDVPGILQLLQSEGLVQFVDKQRFTLELTEAGKKYEELQIKAEKIERKKKLHEYKVSAVGALVGALATFLLGLLTGLIIGGTTNSDQQGIQSSKPTYISQVASKSSYGAANTPRPSLHI